MVLELEDGIYECKSKLPEEWYKDICVGLWYSVSFNFEENTAIVEDVTGKRWFYIPTHIFIKHFRKIRSK